MDIKEIITAYLADYIETGRDYISYLYIAPHYDDDYAEEVSNERFSHENYLDEIYKFNRLAITPYVVESTIRKINNRKEGLRYFSSWERENFNKILSEHKVLESLYELLASYHKEKEIKKYKKDSKKKLEAVKDVNTLADF